MSEVASAIAALGDLPIASVCEDVVRALASGNVLLQAEPGAGKSTGLPLVLLPKANRRHRIVMLEPRRLAARAVAERLAAQLDEPIGQRIGMRMRGETRVSELTVLEVVTEGVLTRMLQSDPELNGIGYVIFDEFHERSLHADLGLALGLEVQNSLRPDLRLLFMSATLNGDQLAAHLERHRHPELAPLTNVNAPGRQYPVEVRWQGQESSARGAVAQSASARLAAKVTQTAMQALANDEGDVLVFLPGVSEIEAVARVLSSRLREYPSKARVLLCRLHSRVDRSAQRQATEPARADHRRIILSTSIAETSLTIDGVRVVIDSGLERRGRLDVGTGAVHLDTVSSSQASATQRAGRAGRTAPGVCYRLWHEHDHVRRVQDWQAELLRADLSELVLELTVWGVSDVLELPWLDAPPAAAIAQARALLSALGILDHSRLTSLGEAVVQLPVHPRLGVMIVWAATRHAGNQACALAALLDDNNTSHEVDIESAFARSQQPHDRKRLRQLRRILNDSSWADSVGSVSKSQDHSLPLAVLVAHAFPDRIAKRRSGRDGRFTLANGTGVSIAEQEPLAHARWLAVAGIGGTSGAKRIHQACELDIEVLRQSAPQLFSKHKRCDWDDDRGRVVAERQERIGSLVVTTRPITDIDNDALQHALLGGIRTRGIDCLPWTRQCRQWQARVQLMRTLPRHVLAAEALDNAWPDVSDEALSASLDEWLPVWLGGLDSLKALSRLDLLKILHGLLDYQQQVALDRLLPLKYTVPSGSSIALEYAENDVRLAVKLQEMFGCTEHPAIADGQLALKVELLSPARRPVQITSDLPGFWSTSYRAVRSEMAGRYPKHPWPEDPAMAPPTARAKPRKQKPTDRR